MRMEAMNDAKIVTNRKQLAEMTQAAFERRPRRRHGALHQSDAKN